VLVSCGNLKKTTKIQAFQNTNNQSPSKQAGIRLIPQP